MESPLKVCLAVMLVMVGCPRGGDGTGPAPTASAAAAATSLAPTSSTTPADDDEGREGEPHYGEVMGEIGRRFELAGRAAKARRFALAAYAIEEMQETFEDDLPNAAPPREGDPKQLAAFVSRLHEQQLVALTKAAEEADAESFGRAFAVAAQTCNACHVITKHPFIQIPEQPGDGVPRLDPLPSGD